MPPHASGAPLPSEVTDLRDGTYICTYHPHAAGECRISVNLGDLAVGRSPFVVRVAAGPVASVVLDDAPRKAYRDEAVSFTVVTLDALGNRASISLQDVSVKVRPPLNAPKGPEVAISPLGNGAFACSFVPTRLGRHVICSVICVAAGQSTASVPPVEHSCVVLLRPPGASESAESLNG